MARQRNHTFDLLCGICILRMMANHTMGFCGQMEDWWIAMMDWTFYFMCFFFFKAGYFNKTVSGDTPTFMKKKAMQLLVPWVVWGIVGNIIVWSLQPFLAERYHKSLIEFEWEHVWASGFWYGNSPLWFLGSFFTAYIVVHLLEKVKKLHWVALAFPLLSWWLWKLDVKVPLGLDNVPMGVFFFFLGHIWHWFVGHYRHRWAFILSIALIAAFIVMQWNFNAGYHMAENQWQGHPLAVTTETALALCGISGLLLTLPQRRVPWINFFGEHSMVFFVCHYPILTLYKYIHLTEGRSIFGRGEEAIILYLTAVCICSWLVPYVESVPWLSGRFKKRP